MKIKKLGIIGGLGLVILLGGAYASSAQVVVLEPGDTQLPLTIAPSMTSKGETRLGIILLESFP